MESNEKLQDSLKELAICIKHHTERSRAAKGTGLFAALGGGAVAVLGLALAPVTLGASVALTVAGSITAGGGVLTVGGTVGTQYVLISSNISEANVCIKEYKQCQNILVEERMIFSDLFAGIDLQKLTYDIITDQIVKRLQDEKDALKSIMC